MICVSTGLYKIKFPGHYRVDIQQFRILSVRIAEYRLINSKVILHKYIYYKTYKRIRSTSQKNVLTRLTNDILYLCLKKLKWNILKKLLFMQSIRRRTPSQQPVERTSITQYQGHALGIPSLRICQ